MKLEWTPDFSVGVVAIDDQHKELFRRVNAFTERVCERPGQCEVEDVVKFLEGYVYEHFSAEEKLMFANAYPAFESHKALHNEFVRSLIEIKKEYLSRGLSKELASLIEDKLCNWLKGHVKHNDRIFGAYLASRTPKATR